MYATLNDRVRILKPVQDPNDAGGFDRTYELIIEIYAKIKEIAEYQKYIRGTADQIDRTIKDETHRVTIRKSAVNHLGGQFDPKQFGNGLKIYGDVNPIKSDWFLELIEGHGNRRFKILGTAPDFERNEFITISVKEIEETETGYP